LRFGEALIPIAAARRVCWYSPTSLAKQASPRSELLLAQNEGAKEVGLNAMRPNISEQGSADEGSPPNKALSGC
jgi:hypothetical protein